MPRFVVLEHDSPRGRHWDLMLEQGGVLLTWALAEPPQAGRTIAAEALGDHRAAYLDYEGPVSGGRGSVTRWDHGTYELAHRSDDEVTLVFTGRRLVGPATLRRLEAGQASWQFRLATPHSVVPET